MMVDVQSPLFSGGSRLYHRLGSRVGGSEIRGNGRGSPGGGGHLGIFWVGIIDTPF